MATAYFLSRRHRGHLFEKDGRLGGHTHTVVLTTPRGEVPLDTGSSSKHTGASVFAELYSKPERLEQFMDAMSGISAGNFQAFAEKFDLSRYRMVCDVGGATGQLLMLVARRHPHLRCTSVDLPAATAIAERKIAAAGLADRVSARSLDFFAEPLPKADVITMGMILHDWNLEEKMHLVRAAYDALPPGGRVRRRGEPDR